MDLEVLILAKLLKEKGTSRVVVPTHTYLGISLGIPIPIQISLASYSAILKVYFLKKSFRKQKKWRQKMKTEEKNNSNEVKFQNIR